MPPSGQLPAASKAAAILSATARALAGPATPVILHSQPRPPFEGGLGARLTKVPDPIRDCTHASEPGASLAKLRQNPQPLLRRHLPEGRKLALLEVLQQLRRWSPHPLLAALSPVTSGHFDIHHGAAVSPPPSRFSPTAPPQPLHGKIDRRALAEKASGSCTDAADNRAAAGVKLRADLGEGAVVELQLSYLAPDPPAGFEDGYALAHGRADGRPSSAVSDETVFGRSTFATKSAVMASPAVAAEDGPEGLEGDPGSGTTCASLAPCAPGSGTLDWTSRNTLLQEHQ